MLKLKRQIKFLGLVGAIATLIIITPVTAQSPNPQPATTSTPQPAAVKLVETPSGQQLLEAPDNQGQPTKVTTGIYVKNLVSLDPSNETFEITGYLYSSWRDSRLAFDPQKKGLQQLKSFNTKDIWIPKLELVNSENLKYVDDSISVYADGAVRHLQAFEARLSSKFLLELFPFDSQKLLILVESFNYTASQVVLEPDQIATGINQESYALPSEWRVKELKQKVESVFLPAEREKYSRLIVELQIQRQFIFYIWNVFIPILFFNVIAWGAFWINPKNFGEQVAVSISAMLFLITFNFIVKAGLPRVPYLILIDGIIFLSYTFIFISLLNMVMVHYMIERDKKEFALKLQANLRFSVPLAFVICNLILFSFLLITPG